MSWVARVRESIRTALWPIPAVCVLTCGGLAVGALAVDKARGPESSGWYLFGGSAEGARALLSTTSASMLTFMALVFSVTIVALQLASGQFSPRVQRAFLRDTLSKLTLGVFIGTYTYTIVVLQTVRASGEEREAFVPGLSIILAVALVLTSVALFVRYIDHIAHSIRAVSVIRRVAAETSDTVEALFGDIATADVDDGLSDPPFSDGTWDVASRTSGVTIGVDAERLVRLAQEQDLTIAVVPLSGDFVPFGGELARVTGPQTEEIAQTIRRSVSVGPERTMRQDVAFGLRQLVDIADRALSPGINDPTTAGQALDALHDLLRRIVVRQFPPAVRNDSSGVPRVFIPSPPWPALLSLAVDEIRRSGSSSIQVSRRLRALLEDLAKIAPASRRPSVLAQLEALERSVAQHFETTGERRLASKPSRQGHL